MATPLGKKVADSQGKLRHFWGFSWSYWVKVLKLLMSIWRMLKIFRISKIVNVLITLKRLPFPSWKEASCLLNEESIFPGNPPLSLSLSLSPSYQMSGLGKQKPGQRKVKLNSIFADFYFLPEMLMFLFSRWVLNNLLQKSYRKYSPELENKIKTV